MRLKNTGKIIIRIMFACVIAMLGNIYSMSKMTGWRWLFPVLLIIFLFINIMPSPSHIKLLSNRLRICGNGCELLILFLISTSISIVYSIFGFAGALPLDGVISGWKLWGINTLIIILVENIVFWNGIIRVYTTSAQLGIKIRIIGIAVGMIPIAHLIALGIIIKKTADEVSFENAKLVLNKQREGLQICKTRYPIIMVHGVFFRDFRYLNYWGRVPKELEKNGAEIFYGKHQSAASVEECGRELAERIKEVMEQTGADKVNIIAHSKGGLDSRYAISKCGMGQYVASLTTINTPHRGCEFADYLLSKIPQKQINMIANTYNKALKKLGDKNPDFIEAVSDLTASACKELNENLPDAEGVYYQSVGSKLNVASGGRFPLNFSYHLVNYFDGENDGLVGEKSFRWGDNYQFLKVKGRRGISHGDMIDLNRENFDGFDVREFYVQLVSELREMGF